MDNYLVHQNNTNNPGTHAIIIGAGAYKHLLEGNAAETPHHGGMGQLSSPPISARKFATWLIEHFNHPEKPLATVALLLAEANPTKFHNTKTDQEIKVAYPSMNAVKEALRAWRDRGESNADNQLIFYFCGHGIARGTDTALILPDYGRVEANVFEDVIDFKSFYEEMKKCKARHKIYFVDACRVGSDAIIEQLASVGDRIFHLPGRPILSTFSPVFYSTMAGAKAYARKNSPSFFTVMLLKALNGAGAHDQHEDWRVSTTRLKEAIDLFMDLDIKEGIFSRVQVAPTDGLVTFDFHHVLGTPFIKVPVQCNSEEAQQIADLSCQPVGDDDENNIIERKAADKNEKPWEVPIEAGTFYEFLAKFEDDTFPETSKRKPIMPPHPTVNLNVV